MKITGMQPSMQPTTKVSRMDCNYSMIHYI